MKVVLQGLEKVRANIVAARTKRTKLIFRAIKLAAYKVQAHARNSILRDTKSGIKWPHLGSQSSAPDEAPANQTGNLARNIVVLSDETTGFAYVLSRAPYSAALEYGAIRNKGSEMFTLAPRPFMRPALEVNRDAIRKMIADAKDGIQ